MYLYKKIEHTKMTKRRNKGLGIGALLGNIDSKQEKQELVTNLSGTITPINLYNIEVNPFQPRVDFEPQALEELADSIKVHGLIQPITVRHLGNGKYQLISGERRLRASKMAGLKELPAYIRLANDQEMIEMALIENIQRQELNPIEIAITYGRLMKECKLTQQQMAERVGKGRATISNYTRLLSLPETIQKALQSREISMGHAKALLGTDDIAFQLALFGDIIANKMSVRQVEELIKRQKENAKSKPAKTRIPLPVAHQKVQDELASYLNTRVTLKTSPQGKGQIIINFDSDKELNSILDIIDIED